MPNVRITEELFLKEQLQQKEMALEQERLSKSQFIKKLTSDFEKPIEQLIQFSQISLLRIKRQEFAVVQNYLAEIKMISEELLLYLKDLRELTLLKSGESKFNFDEIDVGAFLKNVQKKFRTTAEGAGVSLSFHMLPGGAYIIGDYNKLMKVVSILLTNAIQRVGQKGCVKIFVTTRDDILEMSIEDNGLRVDGEFHHHFHLHADDPKKELPIPGFSLSYCKELMIGQKGDIQLIYNKEDVNKFILTLPLSKKF